MQIVNYIYPAALTPNPDYQYGWVYSHTGGYNVRAATPNSYGQGLDLHPQLPAGLGDPMTLVEWIPKYMADRPPFHLKPLLRQMRAQFSQLTGQQVIQIAVGSHESRACTTDQVETFVAAVADVYEIEVSL